MSVYGPAFRIRRLYAPQLFQGPKDPPKRGYFEGWYFKAAFDDEAFAVIPGISYAPGDSHAFIQTLRGGEGRYHRFSADSFSYGTDEFWVHIGKNSFSLSGLSVNLPELSADLDIRPSVRWPSSLASPHSMGWYAYMRFMECYHGIIVMHGEVDGIVDGSRRSRGRFYLEKDWGSSFPEGWIWLQSNSFPSPASVTCSIARVPFRGRVFTGFIAALWDGIRLHRFASYTGARIAALRVDGELVRIRLEDSEKALVIDAARAKGGELVSPVRGAMEGRITESIDAKVTAKLESGGRTVFSATGGQAGLEVVNYEALADVSK